MEGQPKKQWGVTSAISEAQPGPRDLELNDQLVEVLKRENNFETPEGTENRVKVLGHFQKVIEELIRRVCKKKGLPQSTIENAGGKVFAFGSYALGVYNPGSDIDTLAVAPKHVGLDDFFDHFPPIFREMSSAPDITEFVPVREAYVPIIKMEYCGVSIDLLFVSLNSVSTVPKDLQLTDKNLLRGLDDTGMRSVNGTRVTTELLSLVPQVKAFRHATRAIKLWSTQRAIYGAVFGYPGGVAWAIMVARICQLYPFACGATILSKFFTLMGKWHWPRPVMLKAIEEGTMGLRVWNPLIYPQDKSHIMPIITPAFPSMCATHTVMHSTKAIMLEEFTRAEKIVNLIIAGKKTWGDLFERHTFFTKDHKYYLSVIAACRTKESHELFAGLVQSKVRLLVKGIDDSGAGVEIARPYVKSFERVHRCHTEEQIDRIIQGNMAFQISSEEAAVNGSSEKAENGENAEEVHTIYTTTFYIGLTLAADGGKQLDISYPVSEFKRFITMSDIYEQETMSVRVIHTRNYDLPADVFLPGETRPTKPVKEKKKKHSSKGAKRSFTETELDNTQNALAKRRQSEINGVPTPTPA
ncbi:Poly(A) polymeras-like protein [Lindgomyces ingoldianus]|uniref:Poly(A) polymeras-like protein n=1 Tax=Lindgomyces ingoldianus TaxID=673940 RepID=A0ACB6QHU6_9PLEO|nr:Poly(A) polymeras-like protein [Lindgomyces ingoldianus]KAF2466457.1 Poly(A) polymeras-like protein [Lindgomyces ingoldianus]